MAKTETKHPDEDYMAELTEDGHRIEDGGQTAIGDTEPAPPPQHLLGVSVGKTSIPLTEDLEILATEHAAEDGQLVTLTIRGVVTASGGYKRLAKDVERPLTIAVDSAQIRLRKS